MGFGVCLSVALMRWRDIFSFIGFPGRAFLGRYASAPSCRGGRKRKSFSVGVSTAEEAWFSVEGMLVWCRFCLCAGEASEHPREGLARKVHQLPTEAAKLRLLWSGFH